MINPPKEFRTFESFLHIVEALRGPDGCPWDKEQTHRSLTPYAIEEAHELAEAIEGGSETEMVGELGDLLLQVVLHAEIGRQENRFDIHDVIEAIGNKMVRRHPHVFGDTTVSGTAEVLKNWQQIKAEEKQTEASGNKHDKTPYKKSNDSANTQFQTRFEIPIHLSALTRSQKIGSKTKAHRFDWPDWKGVLAKVEEELQELRGAIDNNDKGHQEAELGDLLFSLAQLARHLDIEPEQALRTTNRRFEQRFFTMKSLASAEGRDFDSLTEADLEQLWQQAKKHLAISNL